jgi:Cdc6-like AAA superfamily ATPase
MLHVINEIQVEKDVNKIRGDVQDLGFEQRRGKIERWLSPPDPSTNYNKALQLHQEGSGLWFLQLDTFAEWKKRRNSFLWLYGIPGCGKTILSSIIIEDLERTLPRQSLLYFYFDFSDKEGKQTLENMVRSLIHQLYSKCGGTSKEVDSLFSSCDDGRRQPPCESLCKVLLLMIEQVGEVWIVLDALDECPTRQGSRAELLSWIRGLLDSMQWNVHLLVTSRPEQDIESMISEFANEEDKVPIQSSKITEDIRAYVRKRIREDNGFERWRKHPEVQDEIENRLMERADGM